MSAPHKPFLGPGDCPSFDHRFDEVSGRWERTTCVLSEVLESDMLYLLSAAWAVPPAEPEGCEIGPLRACADPS